MKKIVFMVLILNTILIQGCVIQSNQLSNLLSVIRESDSYVLQNGWIVRYKGYESIVYAVNVNEGILFSNAVGDQILFDGWTVRKISSLGRRQLDIKIDGAIGVRTFKQGTSFIANHMCQPWERFSRSKMVSLSQSCSGRRDYENSILILGDGSISVIRQIVDDRYTPLTLTKVE